MTGFDPLLPLTNVRFADSRFKANRRFATSVESAVVPCRTLTSTIVISGALRTPIEMCHWPPLLPVDTHKIWGLRRVSAPKRTLGMNIRHFALLLISILSGCMTASLNTSSGQDVLIASYNAAMAKQGVEYYCGPGLCDVPPSLITASAPNYPPQALSRGQAGQTSVLFEIEPDSHTSNLRIESSTSQEFASASLDAIKTWRFKPATLHGRPVKIETRQIFPFTLR